MKREEHYCDVCGSQMTYLDSDGDNCQQGIVVNGHTTADITTRTTSGSTSSRKALHGAEFCSYTCFEKQAVAWIASVKGSI